LALHVAADHIAGLAPIDDVRGSADYRLSAAREIVARAMRQAIGSIRPQGSIAA
jgi:CO/xanthine dehydrogenase FAD-binding subunit